MLESELFQKESLPKELPNNVELYFNYHIHSGTPECRDKVRNELLRTLNDKFDEPSPKSDLLNLDILPSHPLCSISISHCQLASGFAISEPRSWVGFDLESGDRINNKVIDRISTPAEQNQAPDPKALFGAKEAAWKALSQKYQIHTISQIETTAWTVQSLDWKQFLCHFEGKKLPGRGFSRLKNNIYTSFFISP